MDRKPLIQTALKQKIPDLVLKNANIINVFTGEIIKNDVAVINGLIAAIGNYEIGKKVVDLDGFYLAPGFIDAHCHVESSMVTPVAYCTEVLPWGTTTVITDPHEITNVLGAKGIQFMLDISKTLPMNYYIQIPSCVPSTPFEHSGAVLTAEEMKPFYHQERVLGLGEMMNYPGVLNCDEHVIKKIDCFLGKVIDGHAPGITENDLQAYVAAGIMTDHESSSYLEAREKLRAGMAVLIREGSACKNLKEIITGVLKEGLDTHHMAFCTDDKHLADIQQEGTISHHIQSAISLGMNPVTAIQIATINAAKLYALKGIGAIAPGYKADFVVIQNLEKMKIKTVYKDGKEYQKNSFTLDFFRDFSEVENSVHIAPVTRKQLTIPTQPEYSVIEINPYNITTNKVKITDKELKKQLSSAEICKIAVLERHHALGNVGVGWIKGYGLNAGAVATTVAHDSHNLIVAGTNDMDMMCAIKELERVQGGYTIVKDGVVVKTIPLPVAGLMSRLSAEEFCTELKQMLDYAYKLGISNQIDPFTTLSFMTLPVIPDIRITDMGLFDVTKFQFI